MPITRTIIVLGALLHAMASEQTNTPGKDEHNTTDSVTPSSSADPSMAFYSSVPTTPPGTDKSTAPLSPAGPTTQSKTSDSAASNDTADPATKLNTSDPSILPRTTDSTMSPDTSKPVAPSSPADSSTSNPGKRSGPDDLLSPTDPSTPPHISVPADRVTTPYTSDPTTQPDLSNTAMPLSTTSSKQNTADNETNTETQTEFITTATANFRTTVSQSLHTMKAQTTTTPITIVWTPGSKISGDDTVTSTSTPQQFTEDFNLSSRSEGNIIREACKVLSAKMNGKCSVKMDIHNKKLIATIQIDADQLISEDIYKPQEEKKDEVMKPDTLIAILASCGALVLILCGFAAYCTYHRRSYRKNQQHLTEELQTVENGYHDNPTLEVMEVQPEMQEKKLALNGEFNDSWIVPIDNLLKENIPDEEDTHL